MKGQPILTSKEEHGPPSASYLYVYGETHEKEGSESFFLVLLASLIRRKDRPKKRKKKENGRDAALLYYAKALALMTVNSKKVRKEELGRDGRASARASPKRLSGRRGKRGRKAYVSPGK